MSSPLDAIAGAEIPPRSAGALPQVGEQGPAATSPPATTDIPGAQFPVYKDGSGQLPRMRRMLRATRRHLSRAAAVPCDAPDLRQSDYLPYAWSAICHLDVTHERGRQQATGFLVSSSVVVTAGHVLNHPEVRRATSVCVTPGRFGTWCQAGSQIATRFWLCPQWNPDRENAENDYGVIFLDDPQQFSSMGFFRFKALSDGEFAQYEDSAGLRWTLAGYPADPQCDRNKGAATQWWHTGKTLANGRNELVLGYQLQASRGQSGSPIYGLSSTNWPIAVGLHTTSYGYVKYARRIDQRLAAQLEAWTAPIVG